MAKVLTAWLPLLVAVLLLLRGCAALLGPHPQSQLGELSIFEKVTASKKKMAVFVTSVAVGMSLVLAVMALLLTLVVDIDLQDWMAYVAKAIVAIGLVLFAASQTFLVVRIFRSTWAKLAAGAFSVCAAVAWIFWQNWLTIDLFALAIIVAGISAYLQWTLNFLVVALAGLGLVIYDIVNVYFTGNMMRVARPMMDIGWPGLVIVPRNLSLDAPIASALGLGDIIFPGLMIMLAAVLAYRHNAKSVLYAGLVGYAVGMVLVFGILYLTKHAQPALITLFPCVVLGILFAARRAGLMRELFAMRHPKPVTRDHVHGKDCDCSCQPA